MAEKKMTQAQALEIAIAEVQNTEAREVLTNMLEKRKAPRKPRENKAAIAFAEDVFTVLEDAESPLTNGDIAEILSGGATKGEDGYISFQKVAAAIRRLKGEDRVVEHAGEKAKDKKTYTVA